MIFKIESHGRCLCPSAILRETPPKADFKSCLKLKNHDSCDPWTQMPTKVGANLVEFEVKCCFQLYLQLADQGRCLSLG